MWAMRRRPFHSSGSPNASAAPNPAPTGRQRAAATYVRVTMRNRLGSAARSTATRCMACHTTAPATAVAPTTTSGQAVSGTPRNTSTDPTASNATRAS